MRWVLLRGLTREARHWGAFAQQFARIRQAPGESQVVLLDLPGNGAFHAQESPRSVRAMVDFARQHLLATGQPPPYRLLAMSLGGMVAADWAQRYPHEVARLVLINTSMRPFSGITERLRPGRWLKNWRCLALLAARWHDPEFAERAIHQLTCNRIDHHDDDVAAWLRIRRQALVSAASAWRQLWAAARYSCAETAPECPTLVLSSSADRLVHPVCSDRLAQAWQAAHEAHPWAGHDLPHDDADWVCQRIEHWLARA